MAGEIFLLMQNKKLVEMKEEMYKSEDLLQSLLEEYPKLLAGDQIDSGAPRKWLLISREMGLPSEEDSGDRWAVDHLFLDQDGVPTLVEVKCSSDTRIRRAVVGQMLDYAANAVVYWPIETIRAKFEVTCVAKQKSSENVLQDFIGEKEDQEKFWQNVKTNLQAGKVRLLFVADEIPSELRRVVEFLNSQMDPAEVLAVEIKQFVGQDLQTLVPRVIGQTAEAEKKKGRLRETRQWDEFSFFEELKKQGADEVKIAKRLLEWGKTNTSYIWWGKGKITGSFIPILKFKEEWNSIIAVWTNGVVAIQFGTMLSRPGFDDESKRKEILRRLNTIEGVYVTDEYVSGYPSLPLSLFKNEEQLNQFIEILIWTAAEIKKTHAEEVE
jgi:hypothetical protein